MMQQSAAPTFAAIAPPTTRLATIEALLATTTLTQYHSGLVEMGCVEVQDLLGFDEADFMELTGSHSLSNVDEATSGQIGHAPAPRSVSMYCLEISRYGNVHSP